MATSGALFCPPTRALVVPAVCSALSLIELQGAFAPTAGKTVIDGEIVCLDKRGRPQFNDLLFQPA